jgi:SAM-dependent methyltransferase
MMKIRKIISFLKKTYRKIDKRRRINTYLKTREPWSIGYAEYKMDLISTYLYQEQVLCYFRKNNLPDLYGYGVDERIIEYPWLLANINPLHKIILDAGSTFNYEYIINHPLLVKKNIFIQTFSPELENFNHKRISYIYGDLRDLLFKDSVFDTIICQSTLEHIGMDNAIYGWNESNNNTRLQNKDYLIVVTQLIRVLRTNGELFFTFPYGKYQNHGFFQQFNREMLDEIIKLIVQFGEVIKIDFFKYYSNGWCFSTQEETDSCESFNPHTGIGKMSDGAAHSRAICCIKFLKSK